MKSYIFFRTLSWLPSSKIKWQMLSELGVYLNSKPEKMCLGTGLLVSKPAWLFQWFCRFRTCRIVLSSTSYIRPNADLVGSGERSARCSHIAIISIFSVRDRLTQSYNIEFFESWKYSPCLAKSPKNKMVISHMGCV